MGRISNVQSRYIYHTRISKSVDIILEQTQNDNALCIFTLHDVIIKSYVHLGRMIDKDMIGKKQINTAKTFCVKHVVVKHPTLYYINNKNVFEHNFFFCLNFKLLLWVKLLISRSTCKYLEQLTTLVFII